MKIAVVGATGIVGETVLRVLEERALPVSKLGAFASRDRKGAARFNGDLLDVFQTTAAGLLDYDAVFFASSEEASEVFAPPVAQRGGIVIDNSSTFRLQPGIALLVPEVNAGALLPEQRIFPVANCTAIVLCVALAPVRDTAGLGSVHVSTYQAVSGAGRAGVEELLRGENATMAERRSPSRLHSPHRLLATLFRRSARSSRTGIQPKRAKFAPKRGRF